MFELTIKTERLLLRPFRQEDAVTVQCLAGDWDVASKVGSIPHPYPDGLAQSWIDTHAQRRAAANGYPFAVTRESEVIGCIGIEARNGRPFEIGYWFGTPYWGVGYATEAAEAVVSFCFDWLGQDRLIAGHLIGNTASSRVLAKLGFVATGRGPRPSRALGKEVDCIDLLLTRDAWAAKKVYRKP